MAQFNQALQTASSGLNSVSSLASGLPSWSSSSGGKLQTCPADTSKMVRNRFYLSQNGKSVQMRIQGQLEAASLGITNYNYILVRHLNGVLAPTPTLTERNVWVTLNYPEIEKRYRSMSAPKISLNDFTESIRLHEERHASDVKANPFIRYEYGRNLANPNDVKLMEAHAMMQATQYLRKAYPHLTLDEILEYTAPDHSLRQGSSITQTYRSTFYEYLEPNDPDLRKTMSKIEKLLKELNDKKRKEFSESALFYYEVSTTKKKPGFVDSMINRVFANSSLSAVPEVQRKGNAAQPIAAPGVAPGPAIPIANPPAARPL